MREVQDIINKLEKDRFAAVTIDSGDIRLFTNYTKPKIQANFGSIENFFKHIEEKYPDAVIIERRQNGTANGKVNYKTIKSIKLNHTAEVQPQQYVLPNALGTPGVFGLGMPELIQLNVDKNDKNRLEIENEYLKKENERLKKVEDELKELKLSYEYSDKKSQQNNDLISDLLNSPVTQEIVSKLLAPKTQGLAQPNQSYQPQDKFIHDYLSLDENSKNLFRNAMYFSQINAEFANEFFDLIEKHLNQTQQ